MTAMVEVSQVSKRFDRPGASFIALQDINFKVEEGEFVSLVGSSGCGKSTMLNIIAGLIKPDQGQVMIRGVAVKGVDRSVGYTFQQATLLPWRSVRSNVEMGLELRGVNQKERSRIAQDLIEQVGLTEFGDAYPHQLSGGMVKRAEIVRVLAIDPQLLLMDEPFGALDAQTKIHMQNMLLDLLQRVRKTVIFITHDLEEAVVLSDRIITMRARPGRVIQEHTIRLKRPRDSRQARLDPDFVSCLKPVWDDIEPMTGTSHAN